MSEAPASDGQTTRPEPTSLNEMQEMPAEDFDRVERYQWGGSASVGRVIDHTIELAQDVLVWRGRENANSLRDFWYNPVKPIVERVFPNSSRDLPAVLSKRLSNAVEDGELTYRDLNILDDSRKRDLYVSSPESDRLIFVEKRAAYRKLEPLAEAYELSIVSGGGQAATAMIEDIVRQLNSHTGGRNPSGGYTVYLLTDYDPSGFTIGNSFIDRCQSLGLPVESVDRIGILPDHLDDDEIARQRYKPPLESDYDREWVAEHGIDSRYGLEIEAIGGRNKKGEALREVVVETISDDIRTDTRIERDTEEATQEIGPIAANRVAEQLVNDLHTRLMDEAKEVVRTRGDISADSYTSDELHQGAIKGKSPRVGTADAVNSVEDTLLERIEQGEIPVDELLGTGGDSDE